jgi:hypothetical protein
MNSERWSQISAALGSHSVETMVEAASQLHREAEREDVPRLLELLQSEDFFVREAAAWPLAELAGPTVLSELLSVYQRGFDDGQDNDGFTAALLEIPSLHPAEAKSSLLDIIGIAAEPMLGHAKWLLEFCPTTGAAHESDA